MKVTVRKQKKIQKLTGLISTKKRSRKTLRMAASQTQEDMAQALGVRQDTISRLERRSDMLLSTTRRYVEAMGGRLDLVATFPNRPSVKVAHLGDMLR